MIEITWMNIAMVFQMAFILSILYAFREQINARIYGVRYKKWVEIDTGRQGYVILNKSLDHCKILGQTKTINRKNIQNNIIYFVNDCAENLKLDPENDRWIAYCNSEEFDTVFKNKLLEHLMMIMERNIIKFILILSIISVGLSAYTTYTGLQDQEKINFLVQAVQSYAAQ
jgi:uncharacterized metal-binding protein